MSDPRRNRPRSKRGTTGDLLSQYGASRPMNRVAPTFSSRDRGTSAPPSPGPLPFSARVGQVRTLKQMPDAARAFSILTSVIKEVSHVLGGRGWNVGVVSEFFPKNPSLLGLNVNRGREIKLRLRHAHDPTSFLEYHDVLGTMVHEMTHIKISKHDASFYKLMDELYDEVERRSGGEGFSRATGEPLLFPGHGTVLGGKSSSSSTGKATEDARSAAIKRARLAVLYAGSGQRLGEGGGGGGAANQGQGRPRPLTPAELRERSLAAAERRLRDSWCHHDEEGSEGDSAEGGQACADDDEDSRANLIDGVDDEISQIAKRPRIEEAFGSADQRMKNFPMIPVCLRCSGPSGARTIIDLTEDTDR